MNQQHRLNVTAAINHKTPIMDFIGWEGAIIIYSMAVMNENLALTDVESILITFLCRSHSLPKKCDITNAPKNTQRSVYDGRCEWFEVGYSSIQGSSSSSAIPNGG